MPARVALSAAFIITVACKDGPPPIERSPTISESRIPIELSVTSRTAALRDLVRATLTLQLRRDKELASVAEGGEWRLDVSANYAAESPSESSDGLVMTFRLVDCATRHHLLDSEGQPTDSIVGGSSTCTLESLWSTCAAVVSDISRFARSVQAVDESCLRAGETDLIDDDWVRKGD
jgi:hypothetical protein